MKMEEGLAINEKMKMKTSPTQWLFLANVLSYILCKYFRHVSVSVHIFSLYRFPFFFSFLFNNQCDWLIERFCYKPEVIDPPKKYINENCLENVTEN